MAWDWLYSNELEALVQNKVLKEASDAIGEQSELMKVLMGNGSTDYKSVGLPKPEMMVEGGAYIEKPIRMANLTARGSATGYDTLTTNANRTLDNSKQDFGRYYAVMNISQDEMNAVRGDGAKVNLMSFKMNEAIANIKDMIADGIYNYTTDAGQRGTGSMTGEQAKGMFGLGTLAGAYVGGTSYGGDDRVWMNVNSDGASWWDSNIDDTAHAAADLLDSTSSSYIQKIIRGVVDSCSVNGTKPSMIVTTKTIYNYLKDSMLIYQRYTDSKIGALGFETMTFDGIPVFADDKCRAKHIYVLNNRMLGGEPGLAILGRGGSWFQTDEKWLPVNNQLVYQRRMWVDINLWSNSPRLQGALTQVG